MTGVDAGDGPLDVLVVEDNPGDARLLQEYLQLAVSRARPSVVDTLQDAIERLDGGHYSIVLLDLSLPDSQGLATVERVAQRAPNVPIIVLTGLDDEDLALDAVRRGAQDYLVKGRVETDALARAMRYALERHRAMDALEEKKAQLEASERRLRTIIVNNADGIVVIDDTGVIRFVNPGAEDMLQANSNELVGQPFQVPVRAGDVSELELQGTNGEPVVAEMRVVSTDWEGDDAKLASLRDITDRKRLEEERELQLTRERELHKRESEFVATASHELRTPLHSIRGFTKLLLGDAVAEQDTREFLTTIDSETERLSSIVEDLLDVAKIEAGSLELQPEEIDPTALIEQTAASLAPAAKEKAVTLRLELGSGLPRLIADPKAVSRALVNLIGNAIKFNQQGGSVTVRARATPEDLKIAVQDTGIGLPADARDRLFQRFSQLEDTSTREHGGTGLGLYITKRLVEKHDGRIWFESEEGAGSTFYVSLPRRPKLASPNEAT